MKINDLRPFIFLGFIVLIILTALSFLLAVYFLFQGDFFETVSFAVIGLLALGACEYVRRDLFY